MIAIPGVLDPHAVTRCRNLLTAAEWIDGNATSGAQSALAKHNEQLPEGSAAHRSAGAMILDALGASPLFVAAALPLKVFPPLFNRYGPGQAFGTHVDNAVRIQRSSDFRIRSDLSMTVFLEDPEAYDGGELVIEGLFGGQSVKLPAGHAVLYPSSSLHHVTPVTRGRRVASFFWIQSMVRDDGQRTVLFDLDQSTQVLARENGVDHPVTVRLSGVYHNLIRRWAEA